MITSNLNSLQLLECWFENDPTTRQRAAFPLYKSTGTKNLSVVYFEIEPGNSLGTHTDSAEEIILVLEGKAEATLDNQKVVGTPPIESDNPMTWNEIFNKLIG